MNKTQCDRILAYLRRVKRATNVDLMMLGTGRVQILCPWKRVKELQFAYWCNLPIDELAEFGFVSPTEKIERHYIKSRGGARVVQYHLVKV